MAERVALGMSGGVDSSVAAVKLIEAGYEVVGVCCVFVPDERSRSAVHDARAVAERLGIELLVRDCADDFERRVVAPFACAYGSGLTPSPCVSCNRSCKFPALMDAADELGCDCVATGHYARIVQAGERFAVGVAACRRKDQSYMLAMLAQEQLSRIVLPLGDIAGGKEEVRAIARARALPVAERPDSQDICFIGGGQAGDVHADTAQADGTQANGGQAGDVHADGARDNAYKNLARKSALADFLVARGAAGMPGDIVDSGGRVLGRHGGLGLYTLGQRKGLGIGGAPEPYYVVGKRPERNELVVGFARDALMGAVQVAQLNGQALTPEEMRVACAGEGSLSCKAKFRYAQEAVGCRVTLSDANDANDANDVNDEGGFVIVPDAPEPLTSPGQFAVLYADDVVLAAGAITRIERCPASGA